MQARFRQILDTLTLPGNARVVAFSGIFLTSGTALWWPLFAIFLASEGLPLLTIGAVFAIGTGITLAISPIGGMLADRHTRKRVILAARGLTTTGTFTLALTGIPGLGTPATIALFYGLTVVGGGIGMGAIRALLFESAPAGKSGVSMSSPYVLPSLVAIPMPFLGSVLSQTVGWSLVFVLAGVCQAISWGITVALLQEPPRGPPRTAAPRVEGRERKWVQRLITPVGAIVGIYTLVGFGQGLYHPFMALYFTQYLGTSVQFYGILTSIEMALVGILALVSGRLVDRLGALSTSALSFGGEAAAVVLFLVVRNLFLLGAAYETWGAIDWFDLTAPSVFIGNSVPKERRATAIGTFGTVTQVPGLVAPGVGGLLFSQYPPLVLMVYAGIVAIAAVLVLGARRWIPAPVKAPLPAPVPS